MGLGDCDIRYEGASLPVNPNPATCPRHISYAPCRMVYVYRLATPAIAAQLPFQEKHMENFFTPINEGLQRVGASQFCTRVSPVNGIIHGCGQRRPTQCYHIIAASLPFW